VDGRGPATTLDRALSEHFAIAEPEQILYAIYDREFPRTRVAKFSARVDAAARAGDRVAKAILDEAAAELVCAAASVRDRLRLEEAPYDVVLSGGTFAAVPTLEADVARRLQSSRARVKPLTEAPAIGAVKLAIEALGFPDPAPAAP
jgi:N-acetylglucosamine kinase-like BadF-type ATPase